MSSGEEGRARLNHGSGSGRGERGFLLLITQMRITAKGAKGAKEIQSSCMQWVASDRIIVWHSDSLFLRALGAFAVNLATW